jgi:hypothetical protein
MGQSCKTQINYILVSQDERNIILLMPKVLPECCERSQQ